MIKVLPIHVSSPGLSAEAQFLMESQGKLDAYRKSVMRRADDEATELNTAIRNGFSVVASHPVETSEGKAIWFVLFKLDDRQGGEE
jgi:hypothetical protein